MNKITNFKKQNFLKEGIKGFNFLKFKNIKDNTKQIEYAKKHLIKLGEGTDRIVFSLGSNKVLKIQKDDDFGFSNQNEDEVDLYTSSKIPNKFLTKIYDYSVDYSWLIAESVQAIGDNRQLKNKFNIDDLFLRLYYFKLITNDKNENFEKNVKQSIIDYNEIKKIHGTPINDLNNLDIKLLKTMFELSKYGIEDLSKLKHWGVNNKNEIVFIDYGFF